MTTKLKKIPFFGSGINAKSPVVTRQRRLNCYYEFRKDGDKTDAVLYGTPGLSLKFNLTSPNNNPLRGILNCPLGLFAVVGNKFYSLTSSGSVIHSHTINSYNGYVEMTCNATQVIAVDGINGYLYTVASDTFSTISSNFPNGAQTVAYLNGFFICELPGTGQYWVSNNGDGSTWNSLAFATASQWPDNIVSVDSLNGLLITFSQNHMEFWQNVGATPEPFQYIQNSATQYGLAALQSRAHVDTSMLFLTVTLEGGYQVAAINGMSVFICSTPDIDNIIQSLSVVSDATAYSYQVDSHKFYQITFPTANRSLLYDITTDMWYEVQTGISTGYAQRHIGNLATVLGKQTLVTDYLNGNVYYVDPTVYTDNGAVIPREVTTRHAQNDYNRFRVSGVYLDMETGVGLQTGQGSNPQVMLQISKGNGRTWGNERWAPVGIVGQYNQRVNWRRVTHATDVVCKFRMTDPVKFVVTSGAAVVSARK